MEEMEIIREDDYILSLLQDVDPVKCKDILKDVVKKADKVDALTVILYSLIN